MYHWQLQDAVNTYLTVVSSQKFEKHVEDRLPKKRNLITTSNPEIQLHRKSDSSLLFFFFLFLLIIHRNKAWFSSF